MTDINQVQLTLELTVAEVNVILRSLGKHPFEEIADLIQKIKTQGEQQLLATMKEEQDSQVDTAPSIVIT